MNENKKLDGMDKKINQIKEEFEQISLNPILSTKEQTIKIQRPWSYYLNWFIIIGLIFGIYIFGYGIISEVIGKIFNLILNNDILNNHFGFGTRYIGYFIIINIIILPIYIFIKNKEDFRNQHIKIALIILGIILIPSFFLTWTNQGIQIDTSGEIIKEETKNSVFSSIKDIIIATKCSIPTNVNLPECIALLQTENAQIDTLQTITIRGNNLESNTYSIKSPQDYIRFQYYIDTPIDIQLTKFECFSSKNFNEPFFEIELDETIKGTRTLNFDCENIGKLLEKSEERLSFRTIIYYETTTTQSIQVPAINCKYSQLADYLEKEKFNCRDVSISQIEKNVGNIPKYNTEDLSSNIIKMGIDTFKNQLPLRLQDEFEDRADLGIVLTPTNNAGELKSGEIKNIKIPEILKEEDSNEITKIEELKSGETLFLRKKLIENELIQIDQNQLILAQVITFDIDSKLAVKKNHNTITLKKQFENEQKEIKE